MGGSVWERRAGEDDDDDGLFGRPLGRWKVGRLHGRLTAGN
jgi:hypothetical protein